MHWRYMIYLLLQTWGPTKGKKKSNLSKISVFSKYLNIGTAIVQAFLMS